MFAFVPFVLNAFGSSDAATWRSAGMVFLLWNIVGLVRGGRRSRALSEQGIASPRSGFFALMLIIESFIDLPLLALALGFFPDVAFALYLVALLTALLQAGIFFMRVVGSLLVDAVGR